jgi:hypothetical protein
MALLAIGVTAVRTAGWDGLLKRVWWTAVFVVWLVASPLAAADDALPLLQSPLQAPKALQCDRVGNRQCWDDYRHCRRRSDRTDPVCCQSLRACLIGSNCKADFIQC